MRWSALGLLVATAALASLSTTPPAFARWIDDLSQLPIKVMPEGGTVEADGDVFIHGRYVYWDKDCGTWRGTATRREERFDPPGGAGRYGNHELQPNGRSMHWESTRCAPIEAAEGNGLFLEFGAGVVPPGSAGFSGGPEPLNLGGTFGVSAGISTAVRGVSIQVDVDHGSQAFTDVPSATISSTDVFALARYSVPIGNGFNIYGGGGLGGIFVSEDYPGGGTGAGLGFKGEAGVSFALSPGVNVFTQFSYTNTFAPVPTSNGFDVTYGHGELMGGVRFNYGAPPPPAP